MSISPVYWRSWKLERVATSSNDAEVQSLAVGEDVSYRLRLLWGEFNGAGLGHSGDLKSRASHVVGQVLSITATDRKGAYDAVNQLESANLGMKRTRTAVEASALKQHFEDPRNVLIWLAADWNLSDGLTKEKEESRRNLEHFWKTFKWRIRFDPSFVVAAKKARTSAIQTMRRELQESAELKKSFLLMRDVARAWSMHRVAD